MWLRDVIACPCSSLPTGRRDVACARSVANATPSYSRRQKEAQKKRAAAQAGTPKPRRQIQVSVMETACAVRSRKSRALRKRAFWDADAFEVAWAQAEWALAERRLATLAFSEKLSSLCGRSDSMAPGCAPQLLRPVAPEAEVVRSWPARKKTERNFMCTHHGQGKKKLVEGTPTPRPTKRDRFMQRLRAQLPTPSRAVRDDLSHHAAYVLAENGSRVRARFFSTVTPQVGRPT